MATLPPCHRTKNKAFTNPSNVHKRSRDAAIRMCQHCPILRQCAKSALLAGSSLDGHATGPASDVIQAGVWCKGNMHTAHQLAAVASANVPRYQRQKAKSPIAEHCVNCDEPMVKWSRDGAPDGFVMHYARNYCTNCRMAYRETLETAKDQPLTMRKSPLRRPDNCVSCDLPMVAVGHEPGPGQVKHKGRGLCAKCYHSKSVQKPPSRRPDNCLSCDLPMVPAGHEPGPGQVQHKGWGLCSTCYYHNRPGINTGEMNATQQTVATPQPVLEPTPPPLQQHNESSEPTMQERLERIEQHLQARLDALESAEQLERDMQARLEHLERIERLESRLQARLKTLERVERMQQDVHARMDALESRVQAPTAPVDNED